MAKGGKDLLTLHVIVEQRNGPDIFQRAQSASPCVERNRERGLLPESSGPCLSHLCQADLCRLTQPVGPGGDCKGQSQRPSCYATTPILQQPHVS